MFTPASLREPGLDKGLASSPSMFWLFSLLSSVVLMAVVYSWSTRAFPALGRRRRTVAAALLGLILAQLATRWTVVLWHFGSPLQTVLVVLLATLGMAAVPIAVMHAVGWLAERAVRRRALAAPAPEAAMTRRQLVEARGGVALLGATGSMLGWGIVRGRHAFELASSPCASPGCRGRSTATSSRRSATSTPASTSASASSTRGSRSFARARPDLLVVTGDLVDFDPAFAPLVARKLADLAPRDGVFAVPRQPRLLRGRRPGRARPARRGRHAARQRGARRAARATAAASPCSASTTSGPTRYGRAGARLGSGQASVPDAPPRILLSHQPPTARPWPGRVALQLSGHTHGGQINPGPPPGGPVLRLRRPASTRSQRHHAVRQPGLRHRRPAGARVGAARGHADRARRGLSVGDKLRRGRCSHLRMRLAGSRCWRPPRACARGARARRRGPAAGRRAAPDLDAGARARPAGRPRVPRGPLRRRHPLLPRGVPPRRPVERAVERRAVPRAHGRRRGRRRRHRASTSPSATCRRRTAPRPSARLQALRARPSMLTVTTAPPGAVVTVDGKQTAGPTPVSLEVRAGPAHPRRPPRRLRRRDAPARVALRARRHRVARPRSSRRAERLKPAARVCDPLRLRRRPRGQRARPPRRLQRRPRPARPRAGRARVPRAVPQPRRRGRLPRGALARPADAARGRGARARRGEAPALPRPLRRRLPRLPGRGATCSRAARRGGPSASCRARSHEEITFALDRMGLRDAVRFIVSAERAPAAKPDPAPYRLGLEELAPPRARRRRRRAGGLGGRRRLGEEARACAASP